MSILNKIAYFQNRRDEIPNQELARELVQTKDIQGIREIAENLWNKEKNIQSDCLKVLYEIGYLDPELITDYLDDFLKLLKNRNNRLIWGGMIAIATIADIKASDIYPHRELIQKTIEQGSVISIDNGIKILSAIASKDEAYNQEIFPYLAHHLQTCRSQDVTRHAEYILIAVNSANKSYFISILEKRVADMTDTQLTRIRKLMKVLQKS